MSKRTRFSPRWHKWAPVVLAVGLVAATYPGWRVAMLGVQPTLEELLSLRCLAR